MVNFQTLLHACNDQIGATDIDIKTIDCGFEWDHAFPFKWAAFSMKQKAGVGAAFVVLGILGLVMGIVGLVACCCD